jgi:ABC-type lipoprotein export system ATPase subunit
MVTHNEEAAAHCDRIIRLRDGQLRSDDLSRQLRSDDFSRGVTTKVVTTRGEAEVA